MKAAEATTCTLTVNHAVMPSGFTSSHFCSFNNKKALKKVKEHTFVTSYVLVYTELMPTTGLQICIGSCLWTCNRTSQQSHRTRYTNTAENISPCPSQILEFKCFVTKESRCWRGKHLFDSFLLQNQIKQSGLCFYVVILLSPGSWNKAKETIKHKWGRQMRCIHSHGHFLQTNQSVPCKQHRVHRVLLQNRYNIIFMAVFILSESESGVLTPSLTSNSLLLWSTFRIRI